MHSTTTTFAKTPPTTRARRPHTRHLAASFACRLQSRRTHRRQDSCRVQCHCPLHATRRQLHPRVQPRTQPKRSPLQPRLQQLYLSSTEPGSAACSRWGSGGPNPTLNRDLSDLPKLTSCWEAFTRAGPSSPAAGAGWTGSPPPPPDTLATLHAPALSGPLRTPPSLSKGALMGW